MHLWNEIIRYWKLKAGEWKKAAKDAKEELDEFQEGSRELEAELEAQLEQAEIKTKELKAISNRWVKLKDLLFLNDFFFRLQLENEQLKDKLEQCTREYHFQVSGNFPTSILKVLISKCFR